jgi:hypothetical protein
LHRLGVRGRNLLSDSAHRLEIRNLRGRISFVLLPMALLVGPSVLVTPMDRAYIPGGRVPGVGGAADAGRGLGHDGVLTAAVLCSVVNSLHKGVVFLAASHRGPLIGAAFAIGASPSPVCPRWQALPAK